MYIICSRTVVRQPENSILADQHHRVRQKTGKRGTMKANVINPVTQVEDGLLYDANHDAEIILKRKKAKEACFNFNNLNPVKETEKRQILTELLGSHGKSLTIESPFHCDYGSNIYLGENFYANHNLVILDGAEVIIGDNVFIAPNVGIYTAGHPLDPKRRAEGLEFVLPIKIGNNVWIGGGVTITPGVTIGDNTVIGAGSMVNRDIPSDVIAVGNPCKVIRTRSEEDSQREDFHRR
ncbi:sugar O-acetyltransferase [Pantoea sp. T14]|uniref:sugar O-acetyltransferase n=1 Tax=unclassified Pantoea TaxID=2630326 RepID=UPI002FCBD388